MTAPRADRSKEWILQTHCDIDRGKSSEFLRSSKSGNVRARVADLVCSIGYQRAEDRRAIAEETRKPALNRFLPIIRLSLFQMLEQGLVWCVDRFPFGHAPSPRHSFHLSRRVQLGRFAANHEPFSTRVSASQARCKCPLPSPLWSEYSLFGIPTIVGKTQTTVAVL